MCFYVVLKDTPTHNSRVLDEAKWRGSLMFFICAWINGWVNNPEARDLRRHRAHYDVTAMFHRYIQRNEVLYIY